METLKLPVALTLSRPQGGNYDYQVIELQIEDRVSGVRFLEVRIALANFARLLTGQGCVAAMGEYAFMDSIGLIRETKTENVTIPTEYGRKLTEEALTALRVFEVDGWVGYKDDLRNMHRHVRTSEDRTMTYAVSFTRFIQPTPEQLKARLEEIAAREY